MYLRQPVPRIHHLNRTHLYNYHYFNTTLTCDAGSGNRIVTGYDFNFYILIFKIFNGFRRIFPKDIGKDNLTGKSNVAGCYLIGVTDTYIEDSPSFFINCITSEEILQVSFSGAPSTSVRPSFSATVEYFLSEEKGVVETIS